MPLSDAAIYIHMYAQTKYLCLISQHVATPKKKKKIKNREQKPKIKLKLNLSM